MLTKIVNFFSHLNDRFSYRQRFIFFSLAFILTTPFPGYWLLQIENFFINRFEWQLLGNEYQSLTGELLHNTLLYRTENDSPTSYYERNIEQTFNKLKELQAKTTFIVRPSLGSGFSETPTAPLNIEALRTLWSERFIDQLIEETKLDLSTINNSFELIVTPSEIQYNLIDSTLYLLPEAQILISSLHLLREQADLSDADKLKMLVLKEHLNANTEKIRHQLDYAYRYYVDHTDTGTLAAAKQSYTAYTQALKNFLEDDSSLNDSLANKAINSNETTRNLNIQLTNALIQRQLTWYKAAKYFSLFIYTIIALLLIFYLIFRVLTRHLMEICYHLRDMTKGNFKECFCSRSNDEFGLIGRTFDKMGASIQDVLGELKNVGSQLSDSIRQISKTAKIQEDNATRQEMQVEEIKETASLIASKSRQLANTMSLLSKNSVETSLADSARAKIEQMQEKMRGLETASSDIIKNLVQLEEKIVSSNTLIAFMSKVSDQASLLSLNAAIETSNIGKHKISFSKITNEIQRFAEKTHTSTNEIETILEEITLNVKEVRREAEGCLKEITEGAYRLINVSSQLSHITKQGRDQIKKFENVNDVMQMQAIAAENIIYSISNLKGTAEENTHSIRTLHESIAELGKTAEELEKTIGLFV